MNEQEKLMQAVAVLGDDFAILPRPLFTDITPDRLTVNGITYWQDAQGRAVPEASVKPMDKLIDEQVRKIVGYAIPLSNQIARFKGHTFDDIASLMDLIVQDYGAKLGGKKGNVRLMSFDGLYKVEVQVPDILDFGPELQVAKALIDECIVEWREGARPELQVLVTDAFKVDKQGNINRDALFKLRRVQSEDPRWQRAMDAITDSIRVIGSKTYVRFYQRPKQDAGWEAITIDLAQAKEIGRAA